MKLHFALGLITLVFTFPSFISGQNKPTALDEYLDKAGTIVIARCTKVGPVNILMRADTEVEILLVVKGNETLRTIVVNSPHGMEPGRRYLLRTANQKSAGERYFRIDDRGSVIEVSPSEKLEQLKQLSSRIIVLRTMNIRAYELESRMRFLSYELDALDKIRRGN